MDEYVVDTFANRDDAIPVINVQRSNDSSSSEDQAAKQAPTTPTKTEEGTASDGDKGGSHKRNRSLQDRLFTKLLEQFIPQEEAEHSSQESGKRSSKYADRPSFSLPLMTNNFRRFNARIGVVFVFQANLIRLFTWQKTSHTLSFLVVYSFVCLHPYLLVILPSALLLFFIFIPAFLARHPPPPSPALASPQYALTGPALAPARVVKPAAEMSRDFFHNMRDLQNVMDDFSIMHDLVLNTVTPWTNFSREPLSSTLFIFLCAFTCALYLCAPYLPWRQILLTGGWAAISLGHPSIQILAKQYHRSHVHPAYEYGSLWLDNWIKNDIVMDSEPEILEVEVFELQRRRSPSTPSFPSSTNTQDIGEWESWLFGPSAWEPMAPARIAGERPKGTRFFEDVQPPPGWEWEGKVWVLDLGSKDWVDERLLSGLEVQIEGERWVFDAEVDGEGESQWRRRRWIRNVRRKKVYFGGTKVLSIDEKIQDKHSKATKAKVKGKG